MLRLASASPRRRELLGRIVTEFSVCPADADESLAPGIAWDQAVRMLALRKAFAAMREDPSDWVLAADTIVVLDGQILGKPTDRREARLMLQSLSGHTHKVATAYALGCAGRGEIHLGMEVTAVSFRELTRQDIEFYLNTDEPYDKAGAYGIQGRAAAFIAGIQGDYTNVVGLPLASLYPVLKACRLADVSKSEV